MYEKGDRSTSLARQSANKKDSYVGQSALTIVYCLDGITRSLAINHALEADESNYDHLKYWLKAVPFQFRILYPGCPSTQEALSPF